MPLEYCAHYDCRCDTAAELAWMAEELGRPDLLQKAVDVHQLLVRCRHVPRKASPGADQAPLPPRRRKRHTSTRRETAPCTHK